MLSLQCLDYNIRPFYSLVQVFTVHKRLQIYGYYNIKLVARAFEGLKAWAIVAI